MNKYKLFFTCAASLLLMSSCYDLDRYPEDQLSAGTFFQTQEHADQAMMGVYSQMTHNDVFGRQFGFDCLGGVGAGYDAPSYPNIGRGTYTTTEGAVGDKFKQLYEGVTRANIVLQNVDQCDMSDELKTRYKSEARFMRALYYFTLLDFWGGVPIYDETTIVAEDFSNMLKPRSSAEEVRTFIIKDLDEAIAHLPADWDESNKGRATSGAAMALKGKVLLYNKQYQEAATCFENVINSGKYALYSDYENLFKPGGDESSEMIFAIQNIGGVGTDFGMPMTFYMGSRASYGSCWNNVMAATDFVDSYEWKDGRAFDWNEVIPGFNENDAVKKECYNQTDQQTKAVDLINQVRARVDMPGLNSGPSYLQATTKEQVFERIRHERAVELAGEGLSFSDMKRWGLLETLAGEVKGFTGQFYYNRVVQSRDYLWPIPNNEIQKNPSLKEDQNPGW